MIRFVLFILFFFVTTTTFAAPPRYIQVHPDQDRIDVECPAEGGTVTTYDEHGSIVHQFECVPVKSNDSGIDTTKLGDVFLMGLRLQMGVAGGFARTDDYADGMAVGAGGSLVLQFPHLVADWLGLEVSAGTGILGFPGMEDLLSENIFEAVGTFHLTDDLDLRLGYRFLSLVDLDESLAMGHYGSFGLSVTLSPKVEFGGTFFLGGSSATRREQWIVEDDIGSRTYEGIRNVSSFAWWVELSATFWFW